MSDLQMQLGVAAQCGMCAASALAIVREEACCASIAENDHLPAAA